MAEHGVLHVPRRPERVAGNPQGIQARLRSALLARGWARQPEPRTRFGQTFLPGLSALGPAQQTAAFPLLARAEFARMGRVSHLGLTQDGGGKVEWNPRGPSEAWRTALHGLDELFAFGISAVFAPTPAERLERYEAAIAYLRDWISRGRNIGTANGLPALARRITNLVYLHGFFGTELRGDQRNRRTLLERLYADAMALSVALPRHTPDPWMIAAGRALFMAGRLFDGLEARGWLETGTTVLWGQLREQVNDDGGHRDRHLGWHAFVLREYLEVLAILRAANDEVPAWGRKRVKGMADYLARLAHPDGTLPLLDGNPVGGVLPTVELLATSAVVLHEPAFAAPGELPGVWPLLVVGESGRRVYAGLPREPLLPTPRALRRTGRHVMPGDPGDVLLLDAGVSGTRGSIGAFAYELSLGGEQMVVGAGLGAEASHPLAAYARNPRARNVLVGRRESALRPEGVEPEIHWAVRDGLIHFAGIDTATPGLRHRRCVLCLPGRFWLVLDELDGSGPWEGESLIHLHPETEVRGICSGRVRLVARRSEAAWLSMVFSGGTDVRLMAAVEGPVQGWHAVGPGDFRPAPTVAVSVRGTLPLVVGYVLLPRTDQPAALTLERDAFELRAGVTVGDEEWRIAIVQDEAELLSRR